MLGGMLVVTLLAGVIAFQTHEVEEYHPKKAVVLTEDAPAATNQDVVNGIHQPTGLIAAEHYELVLANCLSCHSASLIKQNRMTDKGWRKTIRWMQETQKLWDLGPDTDKIIAYLAENYAPTEVGRRKNLKLKADDWYVLEE